MSDGTPLLRVAVERIGAPGAPARTPFRVTNAANWSSIIRIGAKMAVIRRRIARRAVSSHIQRAGNVPYGESRTKHLIVVASVALLLVSLAPREAFAHGGGLNKDGCHNETATGSYHCHRGGGGSDVDWETVGAVVGGLIVAWLLIKAFQTDDASRGNGLRLAPELAADQTGNAYAGVRWRMTF